MINSKSDFLWIDSNEKLRDCCDTLSASPAIAIDTEFMRTDTFYPIAALFQIADKFHNYLIDPLAISDFQPLVNLMLNIQVTKVFHACSEDIEVFNYFLNCVPTPLVDTQIAAALLNHGGSLGYASLVKLLLDVDLSKDETRSNWLQRPLAEKQCAYAMDDVVYLLPLYEKLLEELQEKNRIDWFAEECDLLLLAAHQPVKLEEYYLRIKSAWKLTSKELAVLQALSHWREIEARDKNVPRNHVVHERALLDISTRKPTEYSHLKQIEDLKPRKLQQYGDVLLSIVEKSLEQSQSELPARLPPPLPSSQRNLVKSLKEKAADIAEKIELSAEVLVKKSDYEFIVRSGMNGQKYELSDRLKGWRASVIGDELLTMVNSIASKDQ